MLYVGLFSFEGRVENDEQDEGQFNVIAEAASADAACDTFKAYLSELRHSGKEALSGVEKIFFDGFVELQPPLSQPALIHYISRRVPANGSRGLIGCTLVDAPPGAGSYGWHDDVEGTEEQHDVKPFVEF